MADAPNAFGFERKGVAHEVAVSMSSIAPFAVGAVAVVLLMGLVNMMRGGGANTSQTLMRWRVGLQFVAIIVLMTALYLKSG